MERPSRARRARAGGRAGAGGGSALVGTARSACRTREWREITRYGERRPEGGGRPDRATAVAGRGAVPEGRAERRESGPALDDGGRGTTVREGRRCARGAGRSADVPGPSSGGRGCTAADHGGRRTRRLSPASPPTPRPTTPPAPRRSGTKPGRRRRARSSAPGRRRTDGEEQRTRAASKRRGERGHRAAPNRRGGRGRRAGVFSRVARESRGAGVDEQSAPAGGSGRTPRDGATRDRPAALPRPVLHVRPGRDAGPRQSRGRTHTIGRPGPQCLWAGSSDDPVGDTGIEPVTSSV